MKTAAPDIHPTACCAGAVFEGEAGVGAFSVVMPGARLGRGVRIGSHCHVGEGVVLGDGVRLGPMVVVEAGTGIGAGSVLDAQVSVMGGTEATEAGPGRSPVKIGANCRIGAGATVMAGVQIGEGAVVEAGSVVTACVQPFALVSGHPARITGFVGLHAGGAVRSAADEDTPAVAGSGVRGVTLHRLPHIRDPRGSLTVGEFTKTIPFAPKRYFITFNVPNANVRGEHAHRQCHQFLICVSGSCAVVVDDGEHREEFVLDRPTLGIHVPPMIWATEYKHSADSTLLVFASDFYEPDDYIRDYQAFVAEVAEKRRR